MVPWAQPNQHLNGNMIGSATFVGRGFAPFMLALQMQYSSTNTHTHTHMHAHTYTTLLPGLPGEPVPKENLILEFMVQGKITDHPAIQLGATPSGLINNPPPSSQFLYRMPFLPQASHINLAWDRNKLLDGMPSGLVYSSTNAVIICVI